MKHIRKRVLLTAFVALAADAVYLGIFTGWTWSPAGKAEAGSIGRHTSAFGRAKNAIFFVGDGMGVSTVTATRILSVGADGDLTVDKLPFTALSRTATTDLTYNRRLGDGIDILWGGGNRGGGRGRSTEMGPRDRRVGLHG